MRLSRRLGVALCAAVIAVATLNPATSAAPAIDPGPTPRAQCGPGSSPETGPQGRVPIKDVESGRAQQGYSCNMVEVSHFGETGGYKVFHYVDDAGHECAFYDSTLLFPKDLLTQGPDLTGVYVLDMTDPAHPVKTANLLTPAMQSPHESLYLHAGRGLLMADMGGPAFNLGFVDIYSVKEDCRHPVLLHSSPLGILGHESGLSPDGYTFWVTSTGAHTIVPLDITNPRTPVPLWIGTEWSGHGLRVSEDGNRLYIADVNDGLHILDVSEIQARKSNPQVREISYLTWPEISIPQVAIPVSIGGHPYLVEVDEFSNNFSDLSKNDVGAARIIDIADETKPKVISNLRLEVNQPEAQASAQQNDPGAASPLAGYAAHYCNVPRHDDPGIVACSFILSGLRVFDIRDPYHPKEIAYFNKPVNATQPGDLPSSYAMSSPTFVPERGEIWYIDGNSGFWALRVTNGVWPFTAASAPAASVKPAPKPKVLSGRTGDLPATGIPARTSWGAALVLVALGLMVGARRSRSS